NKINILRDWNIIVLQMEYSLSNLFLESLKEHLIKTYSRSEEDAIYNTGEVAKILMAGGLGSFKPDLVGAWYKVLREHFGAKIALGQLYVFSPLYSQAIKGQGAIIPRGPVKDINLMDLVRSQLIEVRTYKDIQINMCGIGKVDVTIYDNPYSELKEYWLYCPQVFHEAYPGNSDDDFRAVQTLLYRKVVLRFITEAMNEGKIKENKFLFSTSEVNTTLAIPTVVVDEYNPKYNSQSIFKEENVLVHHYNHTIVPAGLPRYHSYNFEPLRISEEFKDTIKDGFIDLVEITARVSDFITGCSHFHTQILRQDIFKKYQDKVLEDNLFGNSEGSDIERWQGKEIKEIVFKFMKDLRIIEREDGFFERAFTTENYIRLFITLESDPQLKESFISALLEAKRKQKERFVKALFSGVFGNIDVTEEEFNGYLASLDKTILDMPFFTFVRRLVPYKCADFILDVLLDDNYRRKIIEAGIVIFIGGRSFDQVFTGTLKEKMRQLFKKDPRARFHVIFIENHNVFTSWLIQQGTDFGGMLSFYGKEAGPTSYCNAQQNAAPTFATLDGVIPERLIPILRDNQGIIVSGTGYVVEYNREVDIDKEIRPNKESFVSKILEASYDYQSQINYGKVSFNALKMGLIKGDITNQAKGLICLWAEQIKWKSKTLTSEIASSSLQEEQEKIKTVILTHPIFLHTHLYLPILQNAKRRIILFNDVYKIPELFAQGRDFDDSVNSLKGADLPKDLDLEDMVEFIGGQVNRCLFTTIRVFANQVFKKSDFAVAIFSAEAIWVKDGSDETFKDILEKVADDDLKNFLLNLFGESIRKAYSLVDVLKQKVNVKAYIRGRLIDLYSGGGDKTLILVILEDRKLLLETILRLRQGLGSVTSSVAGGAGLPAAAASTTSQIVNNFTNKERRSVWSVALKVLKLPMRHLSKTAFWLRHVIRIGLVSLHFVW
ncbi:MAG: hypothetical protein NC925_04900, partial [Candidatus Omnitrophica bacterium]|nr:hypothetical protein [Candidatus Omnitrophota bacterium]